MIKYDKVLQLGTVLRGKRYGYRIDRVLGQGTFGITYLACVQISGELGSVQTEALVAVKEFFMGDINGRKGSTVTTGGSRELFDQYRHKFVREARSLSKLKHPGIVKVVETFDANETSYYVMEYCSGGSLDALIARQGGIPQGEALGLFGQMASALAYMHSRHVLHLDLKPGNVMLHGDGRAVLIDFGLAKQFNEKGDPESSTTIGGGTPGYAPIEQANYNEERKANDKQKELNPMTMDIYALGATLYKMLTGERPPVASDVLCRFPAKELADRGVSSEVIAAIRCAMSPIPDDRYQSVANFAAALGIAIEVTPHDEEVENAKTDETQHDDEVEEVILVDDGKGGQGHDGNAGGNISSNRIPRETSELHSNMDSKKLTIQSQRKWRPWAVAIAVPLIILVVRLLMNIGPNDTNGNSHTEYVVVDVDSMQRDTTAQFAAEVHVNENTAVLLNGINNGTETDSVVTTAIVNLINITENGESEVAESESTNIATSEIESNVGESIEIVDENNPPSAQDVQTQDLPDIEMVYVEGGTFTMTAPDSTLAHSVALDSYYIGKYEVTQELWEAVMGSNPSHFRGDSLPVEQVSWNGVQVFIRKLNEITGKEYRLPTEAEWEYAAMGGKKSRGYRYSGSNDLGSVAWYAKNSNGKTHPVGTKNPNELGIYDMSGNVYEWCQDWFNPEYYRTSPRHNPTGSASGKFRIIRGGSYLAAFSSLLRVANINSDNPINMSSGIGFRLAISPQ